ncbi:MAG: hypothetical protein R2912_03610 [Eubacteriales bacterium]
MHRLKRGCMIIDVSCDTGLEIETSRPTTFDHPVYTVDGVLHYAVDNTPAMAYRSVSEIISKSFSPFVDTIIQNRSCPALEPAFVIRGGVVFDQECLSFRSRVQEMEA